MKHELRLIAIIKFHATCDRPFSEYEGKAALNLIDHVS